jgi:uncharacterized protein YbjQ (UPF0145 family)
MSPIPTESRIFADRYMRELRKREALHSNHLSPGTKNWTDAMLNVFDQIGNMGNPIKRAKRIREIGDYLNSAIDTDDGFAHFVLDAGGSNRSAGLILASLGVGEHPIQGVHEDGINILHHFIMSRRGGAVRACADLNLAYISKHALARMHERGLNMGADAITGVLSCIGVMGIILRHAEQHADGGMSLLFDDTLIVGSLKNAVKELGGGKGVECALFDIRTALPADEMKDRRQVEQGRLATLAVNEWLANRTLATPALAKLAATIPPLPRRDDYTLTAAHAALKEQR